MKVKMPDPSAPGYLRRLSNARKFFDALNDPNSGKIEDVVEFVLDNLEGDREVNRDEVWDLSLDGYTEILRAIINPAPEADASPKVDEGLQTGSEASEPKSQIG